MASFTGYPLSLCIKLSDHVLDLLSGLDGPKSANQEKAEDKSHA